MLFRDLRHRPPISLPQDCDHLLLPEPALLHGSSSPGGRHSLKLQLVRKTAVRSADSDVKPAFSRKEANDRWKIELVDFQKFEEVLTRDVLNVFCCCFIQSDRLLSATSCSDASEKLNGKDSVVFGRDLIAMVWFTIGTLRELSLALKDLRRP